MSRLQNTALSVLDLAPVRVDGTPAEALKHSLQLAQLAENLGFKRFWVAEHHNMDGIIKKPNLRSVPAANMSALLPNISTDQAQRVGFLT